MNTLVTIAWRVVPRLPGPMTRRLFELVALAVHTARIRAVKQLEANLARLRPDLTRAQLRRVSRANLRAYLRYYHEVFALRALAPERVKARVRTTGAAQTLALFEEHTSVVAALGHTGNWDLAGAWAGRNFAPVLTVAEVLKPPELFDEFQRFRADLGMHVLGLTKGGSVFRDLIRRARFSPHLIPLLADRDLSSTSVKVDVGGHQMRVAAGPAALAKALGAPLLQIFIRHERLRGARRKAAGSPWGIVIEFHQIAPAVGPDDDVPALTQAWVDHLAERIRAHPDQWHMLQPVFDEDLDLQRLARSHAEQRRGGDEPGES